MRNDGIAATTIPPSTTSGPHSRRRMSTTTPTMAMTSSTVAEAVSDELAVFDSSGYEPNTWASGP